MDDRFILAITTNVQLNDKTITEGFCFEDNTFRCGLRSLGELLGYSPDLFVPRIVTRNKYTATLVASDFSFDFLSVTKVVKSIAAKRVEITEPVITISLQDATLITTLESREGNRRAENLITSLYEALKKRDKDTINGVAFLYHKQLPAPSYFRQNSAVEPTQQYWIYFILDDRNNAIKIGYSKNPLQRLSELQTGNSTRLRLIKTIEGGITVERKLHTKFKNLRIGGEWFQASQELMQFIGSLEK
ncbi:GIY-YIG nuclease family protein [Microcoleus sp. herbarium7]|uniref:GIY-YIG nuclease family protein n=1 Tax=Microcoleus sp. herbarium7 TaxID=3055435 RepID=UPI002FD0B295